jgi:hypothetical protein
MEHTEIINLWKSYDKKLEDSISINRDLSLEVTKMKSYALLQSMKPVKIFALFAGLIWVVLGGYITVNLFRYSFANISHFFLYSAAIQLVITAIALLVYIYQLVLIQQVDLSEPILTAQSRLSSLRSSTLWAARILFLQLPLWTTFYLSESMFRNENILLLVVNATITLLFTFIAIWLFVNIKYENREKKWFKMIFQGKEWDPVIKSIELFRDIEEYKHQPDSRAL